MNCFYILVYIRTYVLCREIISMVSLNRDSTVSP